MKNKSVYHTTDKQFLSAVKSSQTIRQVLLKLDCKPMGGNYEVFANRAAKLNIDVSRFYKPKSNEKEKRKQITDQQLTLACKDNISRQAVLTCLGLSATSGSNVRWVSDRILSLKVKTDHWLGQGHLKGKRNLWTKPIDLKEVLVKGIHYHSGKLKNRLIEAGILPAICSGTECGISHWHGSKLSLHLDHINGDRSDNRIENLRLLCPNCHSLTSTYCRKKSSL